MSKIDLTEAGHVFIGQTHLGKAVFARDPILAGWVVGEITGTFIHDAQHSSPYSIDIGYGNQLEPAAPFRYLNHSCDPNCEIDWTNHIESPHLPPRQHVYLLATRDIAPGEELTIDYCWPAAGAIECLCRSEICRGWVVAEEELPFVDLS